MITNKVGCIGGGYWGKNLIRNFSELGVLSWVWDLRRSVGEQLKIKFPAIKFTDTINRVLSDPEITAVAIATPAATHAELVKRALLAGKDVLVEKPLSLSIDEAQNLIELASDKRLILMVGHLLWYHPAVLKLKELVDQGQLGRIQYIYSNRLNLGKIRREENILWSFAPHDISVILGLVGEMPYAVSAQGGNYLHDGIADVTVSLLSFSSGVKAHVFVSWLHPFKEQKLVIVGDRQMAVFDDGEDERKLVLYPHTISWKNGLPIPNKAEGKAVSVEMEEPLRAECRHFLECLSTRQSPRTDGKEGLRVLKVLQRCQDALLDRSAYGKGIPAGLPYFAHDSAFIDDGVEIGEGTTIWHVSHLLKNTRIGKHCRIGQNVVIGPNVTVGNRVKVQNNVSVYEGVTLEDDVFCGPSMVFTNVFNPRSEIQRMDELRPTLVRCGATLGANCTIICGVTIGQYAFIGAGAVVTKDVPDFALVLGNPGRIAGWMCVCANRIDFSDGYETGRCQACQRTYRKIGNEVTPGGQGTFARSQSAALDYPV